MWIKTEYNDLINLDAVAEITINQGKSTRDKVKVLVTKMFLKWLFHTVTLLSQCTVTLTGAVKKSQVNASRRL